MSVPKVVTRVIAPGTLQASNEITSTGVWMIENVSYLRSDVPARVTFRKGSGADPVGTVLTVGIRNALASTPEPISGASLTLPSLASTTQSLPVRVYPDGDLCVTVTTYVSPIVVEVIQ